MFTNKKLNPKNKFFFKQFTDLLIPIQNINKKENMLYTNNYFYGKLRMEN